MIEYLLSYPQRGEIQIDFDPVNRLFQFKIPVFSDVEGIPTLIQNYVEARKNYTFAPHSTFYRIEGNRVFLAQKVSFSLPLQSTLRKEIDSFWKIAQRSHQMFLEMAQEEIWENSLDLFFS